MRVNFESLSSTERKVEVFVPAEEVKGKTEEVIKEFQQKAKVRGFRQGKVPRKIVEGMFGSSISEEVSSRLVSQSFEKALGENSVMPVSKPQITIDKVEPDKEFHYTAVFEVMPDFEPQDYTGIELKREKYEVKDEDVERTLNELRERAAEAKPLEEDREVRKGDYAVIDFEGLLDGKPVKDLKGDDVQFVVGEGKLIAEFEDNLVGMRKGEEKDFQVTYPEDFQMTEIAGKTVDFSLKLKDVRDKVLPELDDEFAKDVGEESVENLRKKVRENLENRLKRESENKLQAELLKALVEKNPVDVPQSLVQEEVVRLKREFAHNFQRYGLEIPKIGPEAEGRLRERAVSNLKASIVLGAISRKEGITVNDEEVNSSIAETANSMQVPLERAREAFEKSNMMDNVRARLIEDKTIGFLIEKSNVTEASGEEIHIDNEG